MFLTELKNMFWTNLLTNQQYYFLYVIHYSLNCYCCVQLFKTCSKRTMCKIGFSVNVWAAFESASPTKWTEVQRITSTCAGIFQCLSPGNNFEIGFGVAHSAGRVNWGSTETGFTERDVLFENRIPKSKENPLGWYIPLLIPGWDNRK